MTQTNYAWISDTPFVEGQWATSFPRGCVSALNNTGGNLPFGRAVVEDSGTFALPSGASQTFGGIIVFHAIYENNFDSNGDGAYPDGVRYDIARQGNLAVFTTEAIDISNEVWFYHAGPNLGKFRGSTDANATQIPAAIARWTRTSAANVNAVLAINLP